MPGLTPLARVAWGFLAVVVDVRTDGFDLVLDPLGWVLVLTGLVPLAARDPWFVVASVASAVGLSVSLPQTFAEPGAALTAVQSVVEAGLVFGTCTAIVRLVEPPARTTADRIRWADLGVTGVAAVGGLAVFLLGVQRHPALVQPRVPA